MKINEVINKLRELNEQVPSPFQLPTKKEISEVELELENTFSSDYKKFLLEASDVVVGCLEPCTIVPKNSHTFIVNVAKEAWTKMNVPKNLLPICEDNGNYYCLNNINEVVYWSHDGISEEKWTDLASWIKEVWIDRT